MDGNFQGGSFCSGEKDRKGHEGDEGLEGHEDYEEASWQVNQDYCEEQEGEANQDYYGIEGQEDTGQERCTKEEPISVPIFVVFLFELIMGTWHGSPA